MRLRGDERRRRGRSAPAGRQAPRDGDVDFVCLNRPQERTIQRGIPMLSLAIRRARPSGRRHQSAGTDPGMKDDMLAAAGELSASGPACRTLMAVAPTHTAKAKTIMPTLNMSALDGERMTMPPRFSGQTG